MKRVIDATDLKAGRLATVVAKAALLGDEITIINSEKAVLTGNADTIFHKYQAQYARGRPTKGPFLPRMPDRFLRRILRGMFPYRTPRGRDAFERVMCFVGNPHNQEAETIETAHIKNSKTLRYITIHDLCKRLGGRV